MARKKANKKNVKKEIKNTKKNRKLFSGIVLLVCILLAICIGIINNYSENVMPKTVNPTKKYDCEESGYHLYKNVCEKTTTIDATINYLCPNGYNLNGNQCIKTDYQAPDVYWEPCKANYSGLNETCIYHYPVVQPTYEYGCPDDTKAINDGCYSLVSITEPTNLFGLGQCLGGYGINYIDYIGGLCYNYKAVSKVPNKAICPSGYIYFDSAGLEKGCHRSEQYTREIIYECPGGYKQDEYHICYKHFIQEAEKQYLCPPDFTLKNNKCEITEMILPKITYECPKNYKLENNKCIKK